MTRRSIAKTDAIEWAADILERGDGAYSEHARVAEGIRELCNEIDQRTPTPEHTCKTCGHWKETPSSEGDGECSVLPCITTVNTTSGWNGCQVDSIETPPEFGCNRWEQHQ